MGKYSSFANLLKDQATHDSLPEVLFTDNADLRSSTTQLALATEASNEVSAENIADVVKEFDSLDDNHMEYGSMFSSFEAIANAFASKLNSGVTTLRGIKDTVTSLKDKHEELVAMRIAEDPTLAKILFELAVELKNETGIELSFINLSGGIGIPYTPDKEPNDIMAIGQGVKKAFEEVLVPAGLGDISIFTELGRFMLAPYGQKPADRTHHSAMSAANNLHMFFDFCHCGRGAIRSHAC